MKRIPITLTLIDPIVLSRNNITTGVPESLDYIPGATLLGAIAGRTYADFKEIGLSDTIFHSGQVRFVNGLVTHKSQRCYPMPLSLHYQKTGDRDKLYNLLHTQIEGQPKQKRDGYLSKDKIEIKPNKYLHLRTAIDPNTSTAKEAQLFAYRSLQEGLTLQAHIDCDDEQITEQLYQKIKSLKHIRIGRSRSAHYGRVEITVDKPIDFNPASYPFISYQNQDTLLLWLASDLAVYNTEGQPTLTPTLQDLGLSEQPNTPPLKTFIRTRRYAPYNAYRRSYDLERQVIQQGSVLVYDAKPLNDNWQATLQKGLGSYREAGLGQAVPLWEQEWAQLLQTETFNIEKLSETTKTSESPVLPEGNSALLQWLIQEKETKDFKPIVNKRVDKWLCLLCHKIQSVRQYEGLKGKPVGPTKNQWGNLREQVTRQKHPDAESWKKALMDPQNGIIKPEDEQWRQKDTQGSFADFIFKVIEDAENEAKIATKQDDKDKLASRFHLLIRAFARAVAHSDCIQKVHLDQASCHQAPCKTESSQESQA